jgi:Acetoacetate decarboxylase (ADC)
MILGSADVHALAERAPTLERFDAEALELARVEVLQLAAEVRAGGVERSYPPALHPTLPPLAVWQVVRCLEGAIGSFTMAILRLSCRSGVRPRGFLVTGVIDSPSAAAALSSRFGYALVIGEVRLRRYYDEVRASVSRDGRSVLELGAIDPVPLAPSDLQHTAAMHLAHTPNGLRLVQVEPEYRFERAERATPRVEHFAARDWGREEIHPTLAVSASIAVGAIHIPRIRYACRADVLAFEGTERVS